MAAKKPVKAPAKTVKPKVASAKDKASVKAKITSNQSTKPNSEALSRAGWLQDATLEVPVSPTMPYNLPGQRELEFSVGLRQQEGEGLVRSELRARALVHAGGAVLALAEASYVSLLPQGEVPENIASDLYNSLRPHMESLLALGGHTPPLPASLDKVN